MSLQHQQKKKICKSEQKDVPVIGLGYRAAAEAGTKPEVASLLPDISIIKFACFSI